MADGFGSESAKDSTNPSDQTKSRIGGSEAGHRRLHALARLRGVWQGTAGLGDVYGLPGHGRRRRRLANEIPYEIGNPRRTPANVRQYLLGKGVQPAGVPAGWNPETGPGIVTDNAGATL
jgi:hypothetical protein